jgi:hypothetical protein
MGHPAPGGPRSLSHETCVMAGASKVQVASIRPTDQTNVGFRMVTFFFATSLLLSWWSFTRKRTLFRQGQSETFAAKAFANVFELSVSLTAVLLFYHALLAVLRSGWQWITVAKLVRLEHWLTVTEQTLNRYRPE